MSAVVMDCKALAEAAKSAIKSEVSKLSKPPSLGVISVGSVIASMRYVKNKERDAMECGIQTATVHLPESATTEDVKDAILTLTDYDGIIVQLPLPSHIDKGRAFRMITDRQDVDGLLPAIVGKSRSTHKPCTPLGIVTLLDAYGIDITGKHVVIIGRSDIVGKPLARMLLERDATVTIAHSKTVWLGELCRSADIIVAACGVPKMVKQRGVATGAVVIDVGINVDDEGKLCGDVDFDNVKEVAGFITPVPGGVGLLTRAMLMNNVLNAAKMREEGHHNG